MALLWPLLLLPLLLVLVHTQTDLECLSEFRQSVTDKSGYLSSWSANSTNICSAIGVQCLHPSEAKIYALSLRDAGLGGSFPKGLDKCSSLTSLDLSGNSFSGPIPPDLCKSLPFLVHLDLSDNQFSGSIPGELSLCQYLNTLDLQRNRLTGQVPGQLGVLPRLKELNLVGNQLTGEIPSVFSNRPPANFHFEGNGLCGSPLSGSCGGGSKPRAAVIAGTVVGGAVVLLVVTAVVLYWSRRRRPKRMRDDTTWAKKIKAPRSITVSMFEQFLVKIRLSDLMAATDSFSRDNVIDAGAAATGVAYRATLRDGSVLAVKRLVVPRGTATNDAQFRNEVEALGRVRHANLVPLLGYCIAGGERLLVYKHMANGTLWSWLHDAHGAPDRLDWPARLKVALGVSRGMAFLHHGCNPRILHRSLSAHTILLDDDFEARITDFGLARIVSPAGDHVNADAGGGGGEVADPGHVPPEYHRVPIGTAKGDVYSFGVVLLQLLTSQKPLDVSVGDFKGSLVEWVGALYSMGRSWEAIDKSLSGGGSGGGGGRDEELHQVMKIACGCVLFLPKDRPSMYEVFQELRKLGARYDLSDDGDDIVVIAAAAPGEEAAVRSNGNGTSS